MRLRLRLLPRPSPVPHSSSIRLGTPLSSNPIVMLCCALVGALLVSPCRNPFYTFSLVPSMTLAFFFFFFCPVLAGLSRTHRRPP
ncbi:hypothetical protein F5Y07DRAFT_205022 [Xylaria sp. FL0933]|nr:hypothetical protein F5Y07DRAFT_205022 [Xylaria sp. FL0933]